MNSQYTVAVGLASEAAKIMDENPTASKQKVESMLYTKLLGIVSTKLATELVKTKIHFKKINQKEAIKVYNVNTKEGKVYTIEIVNK